MKITRTSMVSGISRTLDLPVTQEQLDAWQAGAVIQQAMPNLSDTEREFILTGITDDEWNETFPDDAEDDEGIDFYTDEDRAQAKADVEAYCNAMCHSGGIITCVSIEKKWGLYGLTPQMVTSELQRIATDIGRD